MMRRARVPHRPSLTARAYASLVAQTGDRYKQFAPPLPPKTEKSAASRRRLLDIAAELFLEQGYAAVSMQNIADRAGLTKAAIYAHFRSKGQLLVEVIREQLAEVEQSPSFTEALQDIERATDLLHNPSEIRVRLLEVEAAVAARHDPDVAAHITEFTAARHDAIRDYITDLVSDPETVAWIIWGLSMAFGLTELVGVPAPDPDRFRAALLQAAREWFVDQAAEADPRAADSPSIFDHR